MPHKFELKDADGKPHQYSVTAHLGDHGAPIALQLHVLALEPLATGAGPLLVDAVTQAIEAAKTEGKITKEMVMSAFMDNPEILGSINWAGLSAGVKAAILGTGNLRHQILANAQRDEKPLVENGKPTAAFSVAYSRNYRELAEAVMEVCRYNAFFPALDIIADVLAKAKSLALAAAKSG